MNSELNNILQQKYEELSLEEQQKLHEMFRDATSADEIYSQLEKIIYRLKPPTPKEYLNHRNGWITKAFEDSVYDHVREDFINILDEEKNYNQIVEYGSTRCELEDTPILMYDLSVKKIQNIKIGDLLMGDDSKPRKVLELYNGYEELYKVHQNKADNYIVNENHILVLQYTNKGLRKERNNSPDKNNGKIIEVPIKEYLKFAKSKKYRLKGVKTKLYFEETPVVIDPYWMGLWLGDGTKHRTGITTADKEIKNYIYKYAEKLDYKISINYRKNSLSDTYFINNKKRNGNCLKNKNKLLYWLSEYNLINNKHIPIEYIKNSEKIRLELLAGIIDSDGYLDKKGNIYTLTQKDKKLTKDIVFLCRSLGFRCNFKKITKSIKKINFIGEYYNINISGHIYKIPCKLERKQAINKEPKFNPLRTGIKVTNLNRKGKVYGFALDGNQRYLHSDLTVTHNTGKTYLLRMLIHYITIYVHCLRHPQLYYNLSPTTNLSIYVMSFVSEKANQLLLKPIYDMFEMSPRFIRVDRQDQVPVKQWEYGLEKIIWSKAATFGKLTLESKLSLNIGTSFLDFIGADLLFLSVSEINFFIEQAGTTHDEIFRLYSDGLDRIKATVGGNYLGMVYLDSSANDIENPIEKYILNDLQKQDNIFFKRRSRWDARPHMFPIWNKTGETFKICTGDGSTPAQIIENEKQLKEINKSLIIDVPIDVKSEFERNLIKSIKDIAGVPTQRENRLIQDYELIKNMFNNENLENIEGVITADSADSPEKLIWNQVKDKFFVKNIEEKYKIKRAIKEPRWVHVDPAVSAHGDLAGIAMGHMERSKILQRNMYILDFAFCIGPGKNGINLSAIENFILDLKYEGNVFVKYFTSDSFQNVQFKQNLARCGIETSVLSVDRTIDPYLYFINCLHEQIIKCGKNIFLKNNLLSLIIEKNNKGKDKIDHIKGATEHRYYGDFENSQSGINDKDCSDAGAGVIYNMSNSDIIPITFYEEENEKYNKVENIEKPSENLQKVLISIRNY